MNLLPHTLQPLVKFLAEQAPAQTCDWHGWRVQPITGGGNNRLHRVTQTPYDLAVKFTIRDARDRATREYQAFLAIQEAGLRIAPEPIWLEVARFAQPVVVQTWLEGDVLTRVPESECAWEYLLAHYAALHALTPADTSAQLPNAALNASSGDEAKQLVREHAARIPIPEQPAFLPTLLRRFEHITFPRWRISTLALCRTDPNITNFLQRPDGWASVDWENAGWGDPAFEIADLMTHPAYLRVPQARWEWVASRYCALRQDEACMERIQAYRRVMLVWWVVRLCRYLYEIPRQLDRRLVAPVPGWQADTTRKCNLYRALAEAALEDA